MAQVRGEVPELAEKSPRWLGEEEMAAWLPFVRVVQQLPQLLDKQLREQAGIHHTYYMILALLSEQPERRMGMSDLARLSSTSQSRLTHAVTALEQHGWVERAPCAADKRVQYAQLTDAGMDMLRRVAPGHVAEVRRQVFDRLTHDEVRQLRTLMEKLLA